MIGQIHQFGPKVHLGSRPGGLPITSRANFSLGAFQVHIGRLAFWFRLFGFGIRVVDRTQLSTPFRARHRSIREARIGRYGVALLTRIGGAA